MTPASTSVVRSAGVGIALLIVVVTYTPAGLGDVGRAWAAAVLLGVGFVLGEALHLLRSTAKSPAVVPVGLLAVLVAMYLCVPETDQFVVAAIVPAAVLAAELVQRMQLGAQWYALAAASVAWAGMFGSSGRQSALVGALFAWWPILLPWLVVRLGHIPTRASLGASMLLGVVAAFAFARTGGISESSADAVIIVAAAAATSFVAAWLVGRQLVRGPASAAE